MEPQMSRICVSIGLQQAPVPSGVREQRWQEMWCRVAVSLLSGGKEVRVSIVWIGAYRAFCYGAVHLCLR